MASSIAAVSAAVVDAGVGESGRAVVGTPLGERLGGGGGGAFGCVLAEARPAAAACASGERCVSRLLRPMRREDPNGRRDDLGMELRPKTRERGGRASDDGASGSLCGSCAERSGHAVCSRSPPERASSLDSERSGGAGGCEAGEEVGESCAMSPTAAMKWKTHISSKSSRLAKLTTQQTSDTKRSSSARSSAEGESEQSARTPSTASHARRMHLSLRCGCRDDERASRCSIATEKESAEHLSQTSCGSPMSASERPCARSVDAWSRSVAS
eukprot:950900-Pleurochrysis_carterae.AAC.2